MGAAFGNFVGCFGTTFVGQFWNYLKFFLGQHSLQEEAIQARSRLRVRPHLLAERFEPETLHMQEAVFLTREVRRTASLHKRFPYYNRVGQM